MSKRPKTSKPPPPSKEDVARDPTLEYWPLYRKWEAVYSDTHQGLVRFVEYVGEDLTSATVATMEAIAPLPGVVAVKSLKRPDSSSVLVGTTFARPSARTVQAMDDARRLMKGQ